MFKQLSGFIATVSSFLAIIDTIFSLHDRYKNMKATNQNINIHGNISIFLCDNQSLKQEKMAIKKSHSNNHSLLHSLFYISIFFISLFLLYEAPNKLIMIYFIISNILVFIYIKKWAKINFLGACLTIILSTMCNVLMPNLLRPDITSIIHHAGDNGFFGLLSYILKMLFESVLAETPIKQFIKLIPLWKMIFLLLILTISIALLRNMISCTLLSIQQFVIIFIILSGLWCFIISSPYKIASALETIINIINSLVHCFLFGH